MTTAEHELTNTIAEADSDALFDEYLVPQPELFRELAPLPTFLGHVPQQQYSFLSAERRDVYAVILYFLFLRRRAHEIEKYHNDIYDATQPTVEEMTGADYTMAVFRADMDQLVQWGNLERRLEPFRLLRISDRRLQKFLYRLSDATRGLMDSLTALHAPHEMDRVLLEQDHLLDIEEDLDRAEKMRNRKKGVDEELLRRLARCFADLDGKCRLVATEITEFGARIAAFNTSPFQLETLPEIIDWLDRYVDQYLQRVAKLGPALYHRIRPWEHGAAREMLDAAYQSTRDHFLANPLAQPWVDQVQSTDELLRDIVPFFAPEGLFAELCQRVNEQVRALVRKIRQYLDDIRRRNIRIQALRRRTREVMRSRDDSVEQVRAWLKELVGSAHQLNDRAGGTPSRRAAPPRPTYWRRRLPRPAFQGSLLERRKGSLELKRELERARITRLGRFVNEALLRGDPARPVTAIELDEPMDVRSYLDAVKAYTLGRKRERRRLAYRLERPADAPAKTAEAKKASAEFKAEEWRFISPNYRIVAKPMERNQ